MDSVLITGAGSGIGAACAQVFSSAGYRPILLGRNLDKLRKTASQLKGPALTFSCDVGRREAQSEIADFLKSSDLAKHPLRCVINNAAIFARLSFLESNEEQWMSQVQTNLLGPSRVARACYPFLKETSGANLVNISSTLGIRPVAFTGVYSATKAALNQLTQILALEWAPQIRVNAVCPGLVDTPIHAFHGKAQDPARLQADQAQPLKRMGRPEEIAKAALFLCSQDSAWTTGSLFSVDGGIGLL